MTLFRRKPDPLSQRAQSLSVRIAKLESQISKLNAELQAARSGEASMDGPQASLGSKAASGARAAAAQEPIFESMPPKPQIQALSASREAEALGLGLKRMGARQWWERVRRHLTGAPPANDKLLQFLAAGGLQGLRPLRYERRVARNRIIFLCVVLALILWGLLLVFWKTT
jgi:hypothetical protein